MLQPNYLRVWGVLFMFLLYLRPSAIIGMAAILGMVYVNLVLTAGDVDAQVLVLSAAVACTPFYCALIELLTWWSCNCHFARRLAAGITDGAGSCRDGVLAGHRLEPVLSGAPAVGAAGWHPDGRPRHPASRSVRGCELATARHPCGDCAGSRV